VQLRIAKLTDQRSFKRSAGHAVVVMLKLVQSRLRAPLAVLFPDLKAIVGSWHLLVDDCSTTRCFTACS